jgi:predicted nucleotidyltransferase
MKTGAIVKRWKSHLSELLSPEELDLDALKNKNYLDPSIWIEDLYPKKEVVNKLLNISRDFFSKLNLKNIKIYDIIITGSIAGYNWSKYSDIDLHILIDFKEVDENVDLVKDYFDAKRYVWNKTHDIMINKHEVEIYIQDVSEPHISSGIYSLMKKSWLTKPEKEDFSIDDKNVTLKVNSFVDEIDRLEGLYKKGLFENAYDYGNKLKEKIKRFRTCGLEKDGIFSVENLTFKVLRRTEYIGKLMDIITNSYDRKMSINNGRSKKEKRITIRTSSR